MTNAYNISTDWKIGSFSYFAKRHFTVTGENEAGVDLVLIQPLLLYYVNQVFLTLTM